MDEYAVTDEDDDALVVLVGEEAYLVDKHSGIVFTIEEDESVEPVEVGVWNMDQRRV
eukprot:SAG31_NODE_12500_length_936_cov_10.360812_1_plen_56_part_10